MKATFAPELRCVRCGGDRLALTVAEEDDREVREGCLTCPACQARFLIRKGIPDFVEQADETIRQEVEGWHTLAGPLGDHLEPTMAALPYYPHVPWPHLAPDFFQIFELVDFAGKRVVDLGAGRAWSSRHLATLGRAAEVVAVDVLTRRFLGLETAEIFFREDGLFFERLRADMHQVPLRDGWADVIVSVATIHHSSDLDGLFGEAERLLRQGGELVFLGEPSKRASIKTNRPDNEETAHGINEHVYSYAEYMSALRRRRFGARHVGPRSVTYRLLYPDDDFWAGLPAVVRRLARRSWGRAILRALIGNRWLGPFVYRWANLPLTVRARKRG